MATESLPPEVYEHLRHLVMGTTRDDKDPDREMLQELCVGRGLTRYTQSYPGAMRYEITSEGVMALRSQRMAPTPPANNDNTEREAERTVLASGDDNTLEILRIGSQTDLPGELKMLAILNIDLRYAGRDSNEWGTLIKVSDAAVRQYGLWKALQSDDGDEIKHVMQALSKRLNEWTNRRMKKIVNSAT
jgi:hypothetical protein